MTNWTERDKTLEAQQELWVGRLRGAIAEWIKGYPLVETIVTSVSVVPYGTMGGKIIMLGRMPLRSTHVLDISSYSRPTKIIQEDWIDNVGQLLREPGYLEFFLRRMALQFLFWSER